ncbi:MAG: tetratricopeptide repeat protein [Candidatus Manganitrophus sp.]|nr:tetratricopeptide repeat protein [Candidatus Manganitrophus sp.]WDT73204.1 MAG: tetratricopeptide repeat protein [Candidatus Manganitrophus sp.]
MMERRFKNALLFFSVWILFAGCSRQLRPDAVGPTHLEEGLIAYDQNRLDDALKSLDAALKLDPQNTEALFRRGVILQKQNKVEEAVASYREVVRIDPNHFKAHHNLANIYSYEKANNVQAIFHYRRFLSLAPTHPLAPRAQMRLAELTDVPGDKLARGKGIAEEEGDGDIHLTGELAGPPLPVPMPPAPVALAPSLPAGQMARTAPPEPALSFPQVVCVQGEMSQGKIEGSGFIVGGGYILASGHQANQASRLMVQFQNGAKYPASVISVSSALDLALLQIAFQETEPLSFASSDNPKAGASVMAVGCPFGLNHSASQGIISAPERVLGDRPVLQIDVAINPGNSGGPLLNKQGEVVGVVLGTLQDARGIAFAVPGREVKRFLGETFFQMGTLLAEAKRYPEASDLLAQSIRFWPQSAKAHNNLGEVFRRMKEMKKAEEAYVKALEVNPKYADAHFNIGTFYDSVLRNPQKAALHYKRYLELKPTSPEAVQVAQWLKAIEGNK